MNDRVSCHEAGPELIGPLERRFGALVGRAGAAGDPEGIVGAAAAEVMQASADGHSCLSIATLRSRLDARGIVVTEEQAAARLAAHPWVTTGGGSSPLVLEHQRLYLRRHRDAEVRVASALLDRADAPPLDRYPAEMDRQEVAIRQAIASRLTIVTGGPGTGKTTMVAGLLQRLLVENPRVRVALAAPTGKAATRMGEAILTAWARTGESRLADQLEVAGQTLHRLLRYQSRDDRFLRNALDPLEHDVIIVDETSMVPLGMMDALLQSVRSDARLVLLGDHGQLTSVETGAVLGDIVESASTGPLRNSVVHLTRSHRFEPHRGIGALARAVRDGDLTAMHHAMAEGSTSVVRGTADPSDGEWIANYATRMLPVFEAGSPREALSILSDARILCATNVGPAGTEQIGRRVEAALARAGVSTRGAHYHGRPLLITRNDYELDLFNGDIGIVWNTEGGTGENAQAVVSVGPSGETPRSLPLPQLPDARTAWTMSIHRSQGSEFDDVIVVLPERDLPMLSRELIYTAITRARRRVVIVGPDSVLDAAVARTTRRESALGLRLTEPSER
jgi:exodeoxyribonuclease V alpha subunit